MPVYGFIRKSINRPFGILPCLLSAVIAPARVDSVAASQDGAAIAHWRSAVPTVLMGLLALLVAAPVGAQVETSRFRVTTTHPSAALRSIVAEDLGSCTTGSPNPNPNPASFAVPGDFNGDCKSDILWRNTSTDQVYLWLMNGTAVATTGSPGTPSSSWVIQGVGDFNGDGYADILWRNSGTHQIYLWLMNGTDIAESGSLGNVSSDWNIAGVGDFNGDGYADILWQNSTTGQVYIWLMNGTTVTGGGSVNYVSSGWTVQGIGDFDGDGKADILWRNSTTGQVYVWLMNGTTITGTGSPGSPTSDWSIAGVGDFDENGTSDILWRNSTTGQVYLWFMNGTVTASSGSLGYVSSDWAIQGVGDYDGSGRAGILWRNSTTEQVYVWLMNGTTITSTGSIGTPPNIWQITSNGALAAPAVSPPSGTYSAAQSVSLVLPTGVTGCYTVDGSQPAANSAGTCSAGMTYSSPISVVSGETINALATEAGWTNSPVASAVYTINSSSYADNFVRANGSLGSNWVEVYGANAGLQISNDQIFAASAPAEHAFDMYVGGSFSNNQWSSFTLENGPGSSYSYQGALVRGSSTSTNWYNDAVSVGGTFQNLGNGAANDFCLVSGIANYAKGDTHELDVAGSGPVFFWSKHNGVVDATCVDTALNYTGGSPGLGTIEFNSSPTVSSTNWQGGSLPSFSATPTDNFTRANAGWLGVNWWFQEPGGAGDSAGAFFILKNNAAVISVPNQWGVAVWTTPFNVNQSSAISLSTIASGDYVGPVVRYSLPAAQDPSSETFYMIYGSNSGLMLDAFSEGNWVMLKNYGSYSGTINTLELDASGTSPVVLTLKVNGTQFGTTYSDSTYKFAGQYTGFGIAAGSTQNTTITGWTGANL